MPPRCVVCLSIWSLFDLSPSSLCPDCLSEIYVQALDYAIDEAFEEYIEN
jgi:hypothetical protein